MMKKTDGFVSLFTAIIISLLLIVIVLSMVGLETLQLRKAEDAEQTLRAYYTAEAGVEDAVSKVLDDKIYAGHGDNVCNTDYNYDIPGAAGWTCQEVSFNGSPTGKLENPDAAVTIAPGNVKYNTVLVQWDETNGNASQYDVPVGNLPNSATYTSKYLAPPIELAIVQYPPGGFAQSQVGTTVTLGNVLVVPGGPTANGQGPIYNYNSTGAPPGHGLYYGNCIPNRGTGYKGLATPYSCYAVFKGLNGADNYLFRIRSRYMPTEYSMTFYLGANAVAVPTGTATIDVTARAGQTYRRVISLLPLGQGAASGLNFVMYSDQNVCKNFNVINNKAIPTACEPF
jgi:Tfp pilus assembly protein PilX